MAEVYCEEKLYAQINNVWTDITASRVTELTEAALTAKRGFTTNAEDDRLSDVGTMSFWMNNSTGLWDPSLSTATSGWGMGVKIVVKYTYEEKDYIRFYGVVTNLIPDDIIWSSESTVSFVKVTVLDWMQYLYSHRLPNTTIQTDKTADQALDVIVSGMSNQPLATSYDTGVYNFEALFDTTIAKTKGVSEANKIVLSEVGYYYTRCDTDLGETVVFENAHHRNGLSPLSNIPLDNTLSGALLKEDGGFLLKEDGGKIILDVSESASFDTDNFLSLNRDYGANVINQATITTYPKVSDDTPVVLYKIERAFTVAPGQTKVFDGVYKDPNGDREISVYDSLMIQPVGTTDYTMNTKKDGSGIDLTADHVVSVVYGSNKPTITITNNSVYYSAVTLLQLRGQGIYQSDTVSVVVEDTDSITSYGVNDIGIDQMYQVDSEVAEQWADRIVFLEKDPRGRVNKINLKANRSSQNMYAFLTLDIGDLIRLTDSSKNIDSYFWIQGISFTVTSGTIIDFTWIVKEHYSESAGSLTAIEVETSGGEEYIEFKPIKDITNPAEMSIVFDIYIKAVGEILPAQYILTKRMSDASSGFGVKYVNSGGTGKLISMTYASNNKLILLGLRTNDITEGAWHTVALTLSTIDNTSVSYLDGGVSSTGSSATGTSYIDDEGNLFRIGVYPDHTTARTANMKIKNIKLYNVKLTASEVLADYNGTVCLRGLIFYGAHILTSKVAHYTDLTMTADDKVIDNIYGVVGTPTGSPICRI